MRRTSLVITLLKSLHAAVACRTVNPIDASTGCRQPATTRPEVERLLISITIKFAARRLSKLMDGRREIVCSFLGSQWIPRNLFAKRKARTSVSDERRRRGVGALCSHELATPEQPPKQNGSGRCSRLTEQLQLHGPLRRRTVFERVDEYRQQLPTRERNTETRSALLRNFVPVNEAAAAEGLGLDWDKAVQDLGCQAPETVCPVIRFTCRRGHVVSVAANSELAARGECPVCQYAARCGRASSLNEYRPSGSRRYERYTLEMLQMVAMERGGELVSSEYVNARRKLLWRCGQCKHEWFATTDNILRLGSWCPVCARRQSRSRVTLTDMQAIADMHGGVCLSTTYRGAMVPLQFRCADGHEFWATPNNVRRGVRGRGSQRKPSWCPMCARERLRKQFS
jgi:hypothetical protein